MNKHTTAIVTATLIATSVFAQSTAPKRQPELSSRLKLAQQYCEKGLTEAQAIKDEDKRDFVLEEISVAQADAGDVAGALRTSGSIQRVDRKRRPMQAIASAQAKAGNLPAAREIAEKLAEGKETIDSTTLFLISKGQAEAGDVPGALRTADEIDNAGKNGRNDRYKIYLLYDIAVAQVKFRDVAGALRTISERATDPKIKAMALRKVAAEQVKAGDSKGAESTIAMMPTNEDKAKGYLEFISELLGKGPVQRQE
jgi:hypothetical protein